MSAAMVLTYEECEAELDLAREKIANLEAALVTARRIGTAVGIVMATYKVTDSEAFTMLAACSQSQHRKPREVAQDVVDTGTLTWADN